MLKLLTCAALIMVSMARSYSMTEARLLTLSASGQSAILNLGVHDKISPGDYAVFGKTIRPLSSRELKIVPVAKAKNIKVNGSSSIWILYHVYDPKLLVKNDKYIVFSETNVLEGRKDPEIERSAVVGPEDDDLLEMTVKNHLNDDRDRLVKLKDGHSLIAPAHTQERKAGSDFDVIDVDVWKKSNGDRYRSALYKSPHKEDFKRKLRLETFQKVVTNYFKKVNQPNFSYERFYDEQMKTNFSNEFRDRSNFVTEYEDFLASKEFKSSGDAKIYRAILEKGESWSEDFSDEELRIKLAQISVLQEKDRRKAVISRPNRYSVIFDFGTHLGDEQTRSDRQYRRESLFTVEGGFEFIPILGHESLERFTLDGSLRYNQFAFESQNYNAAMDEFSVTAGANWYPMYAPYTVEAPVFFLGTYLRSGFAVVASPSAQEKGKYTVLSLPGIKGGMKYQMKNNVGVRVMASMETLKLQQYEVSTTSAVLPDATNIVETKIGVGLAYSF